MKDLRKDFYGHVVLYCKNHYKGAGGIVTGMRRLFAARCGVPIDTEDMDDNIANKLYILTLEVTGMEPKHLAEVLHRELWRKKEPALEVAIRLYAHYIAWCNVKDEDGKKVLLLPKPKKRIYNKILKGEVGDNYSLYKELV